MQTRNEPVQAREPFMKMQWKIGNVQIDNPFVLAPMAGVTDLPFRTLCKEQGAGLICMEMISAKAISFHNKNTIALMEIDPCEHPVSMQLFGSEPDLMAEVAKSIEDRDFDILDINMGCPVPKVVNNGEGSALLKNPNLIEEIVRKVSSAISKPLTVKVRIGFENEPVAEGTGREESGTYHDPGRKRRGSRSDPPALSAYRSQGLSYDRKESH